MSENNLVKDILSDAMHPLHDDVANTVIELQNGATSMCACIGPMFDEPYCPCEMKLRGLEPSIARKEATAAVVERLNNLAASGLFKNTLNPFDS